MTKISDTVKRPAQAMEPPVGTHRAVLIRNPLSRSGDDDITAALNLFRSRGILIEEPDSKDPSERCALIWATISLFERARHAKSMPTARSSRKRRRLSPFAETHCKCLRTPVGKCLRAHVGKTAEAYSAACCRARRITSHTRPGVAGMSMWCTPYMESASTTAFITDVIEPAQPASPHPFTPSGFVLAGSDNAA